MNIPDLPKFRYELKMNIPNLPIAVFKTFIMQSVHSPPGVYWQPNKSTDKDTSAGSNHGFFSDIIIIMRLLNHIWSKSFDLSFVTICQNPSHMFLRNLPLNENFILEAFSTIVKRGEKFNQHLLLLAQTKVDIGFCRLETKVGDNLFDKNNQNHKLMHVFSNTQVSCHLTRP